LRLRIQVWHIIENTSKQPDELDQGSGGLYRILLVEDERHTAETMGTLLRSHGYEVLIAMDGATALTMAQNLAPHVILLDLGLPRMDGLEVAKRIREQRLKDRPLVVAVTGLGRKEDRLRSYEAGIDFHLTKPVTIEELLRLLESFQAVKKM
jgi:two-component system CheB/CheR fusion protein